MLNHQNNPGDYHANTLALDDVSVYGPLKIDAIIKRAPVHRSTLIEEISVEMNVQKAQLESDRIECAAIKRGVTLD